MQLCNFGRLSLAESELSISESRVNELSRLLQLTKDEQSEAFKHHQMDAKRDKEERLLLETRLNKELMELSEAKFQLEKKVRTLNERSLTPLHCSYLGIA